jgi:hypothetical protein
LEQDVELFRSLLSGRDAGWAELQLEQIANGRLFDRNGLGLKAETDISNLQTEISPDLQAAELKFDQSYALQNARGITQTVQLQQTAVYRRGNHQWLYAPPTEEYWGGWQTWNGRHLAIAYRQRDEDIVEQLAFDFEALIAEVCQLPDMACSPDLNLHLRLDSNPESLLITADTSTLLGYTLRLNLPAPSLVGIPTDEASYQALWRGYSRHLAIALIVHQANYTCCRQALLHRAWLDWQLYQLGLYPWPLTTADYDQLFYNNVQVEDYFFAWDDPIDSARWQRSYMLVQFLATESDRSPVAIQRSLPDAGSYNTLLTQIMGDSYTERLFDFLVSQTTSAQSAEVSPPLPEEDILYVCQGRQLQRYDLHNGELLPITNSLFDLDSMSDYMILFPFADGFLLDERYFSNVGNVRLVLSLVDENGRRPLFDSETNETLSGSISFSGISPDNRYVLLVSYADDVQDISLALLDLADCPDNDCRMIPLTSWPIWSPSGQKMLQLDQRALTNSSVYGPLLLANGQGQNPNKIAENVAAPFWLDEETVGYFRLDGAEQVLVTRQLGNPVEEVVARTTDLQTLLPDLTLTHTLFMRYVYTSPANPDLMLLMAMSNNQSGNLANHYFLVERKPEGADIFLIREVAFNSYARFSPNGRLLLFVSNNPISSSSNAALDIVNLETGQEQHLVTRDGGLGSDWSADGNWLVQLYEQYLLLMAPAYNYEQIIPGDFASCGNVIWVNK